MPIRVFRRTPSSEKAAMYGYKDLLKDSISLLKERATGNVERMTSGGLGSDELLEMATAGGGMLKIAGTSKLLAGLLKNQIVASQSMLAKGVPPYSVPRRVASQQIPARKVFREALKIPEKEYGRIRDIRWSRMRGEASGTKGLYFPLEKDIALNLSRADPQTIWHEFTHARQWNPEKHSRMPGGKGTEKEAAFSLQDILDSLRTLAEPGRISASEFYNKISPVERHARGVASGAVKYPKDFETIYKFALQKEVIDSRQVLHDLLRQLERAGGK